MQPLLLIIDDDELSRDVLTLHAGSAAYSTIAAPSGQAALELLAAGSPLPEIVLCDLQMPGLSGASLARLLRAACGPDTLLVAISATRPMPETLAAFDAFLLKPFSIESLKTLTRAPNPPAPTPLSQNIYDSLAASMPSARLHELYTLCLDDSERRLHTMELAAAAGDTAAYHRAAHAIKGSCGMVGAAELAALATNMERSGPPAIGDGAPFTDFAAALARLRRILNPPIQ